MMIRVVSMSYVALVAALIFGLYHVKLDTRALEKEKADLTENIGDANADISVLEAEWATRTSPDYLKPLVADYLPAMKPADPMQMSRLEKIPPRSTPDSSDQIEQLLSMVELRPGSHQLPRSRPTL